MFVPFFLLLYAVFAYDATSNVVTLNDHNFDNLVYSGDGMWFIKFYAPWCGHCKKLQPVWEELASMEEDGIRYGAVDCTVTKICKRFDITGYPHILLIDSYTKGNKQYPGSRTKDAIAAFAKKGFTSDEKKKASSPADTKETKKAEHHFLGSCVDAKNNQIGKGVTRVTAKSLDKCLDRCRKKSNTTACEYWTSDNTCIIHTQSTIKHGSKDKGRVCVVFGTSTSTVPKSILESIFDKLLDWKDSLFASKPEAPAVPRSRTAGKIKTGIESIDGAAGGTCSADKPTPSCSGSYGAEKFRIGRLLEKFGPKELYFFSTVRVQNLYLLFVPLMISTYICLTLLGRPKPKPPVEEDEKED